LGSRGCRLSLGDDVETALGARENAHVNVPRKHHYVPQSYLARFTDTGKRTGRLHVLDRESGKQWASSPADTGCQRDFYLLEVEAESEQDALAVETFFSTIEGHAREAIDATLTGGAVPEGELRLKLVGFLAAQALRVPGFLDAWDDFNSRILKRVVWYLAKTPEERALMESEDTTVSMDQVSRLGPILKAMPHLAALLSERHWTLVVAEDDAPDFICSDRPLTICWDEPPAAKWMGPAFGMPGTTAQIPLSRRAALLGRLEDPFPMTRATPLLVGTVNMWSASYATRFIYSAESDFFVILPDRTPGGREDVVRHADEKRDNRHR
jgi:hypothetical protein